METERILITVRTYPVISAKYMELVCTGGITDDHQWRRLVPVPLRYLEEEKQYRTFDVVQVEVRPGKDGRPETRTPHLPTLRVVEHLTGWNARWEWVNPTTFLSLRQMKGASRTLAPVAVSEILEFIAKPARADWTREQKERMKQHQLFDEYRPLEKIPFDFRLRWRDGDGDEHNSLVMAWEFGQTWRQYRKKYENPISRMRDKWLDDLCGPNRRVSFFMGNLAKRRNVFGVCGIFSPPREATESETFWSNPSQA